MQNCCINKYIGVKGLCSSLQDGMLLTDYEGISLKTLAKGADESYANGKQLFDDMLAYAWHLVVSDYKFGNFKNIQLKNISQPETTFGKSANNIAPSPLSGFWDISFEKKHYCDINKLHLISFALHVYVGGQTTIKLNDEEVFTGILDSESIYEIPIDKDIDIIKISIDMTNIKLYEAAYNNDFIVSQNAGIQLKYYVKCSIEKYLCTYAEILKTAVFYKFMALLWQSIANSSRINDFIEYKKGKDNIDAIYKAALYDSTFNEMKNEPSAVNKGVKGRYQIEMEKLAGSIPAPKCKCCLECQGDKIITVLT